MTTPLKYSNGGSRLCYHPDFHPNHGSPWSTKELAYLCHHYEATKLMTLALDMGRTQTAIAQKKLELVREGRYQELKQVYREKFM